MPRAPKAGDPSALKRVEAGTYRSGDGRFTVQQASGRWLVTDEAQHDDLGLPLVRGPFETLDLAREAIADARTGPAPTSDLPRRLAAADAKPKSQRNAAGLGTRRSTGRVTGRAERRRTSAGTEPARRARPRSVEIRRYERSDGDAMRALWRDAGLGATGDDDDALALLADRNPGLVLIATDEERIVGTALGAWDGRRGSIYHVAVANDHRRAGLGRRLVHEVERKLRALGCTRVNVMVEEANDGGRGFWTALGYEVRGSRVLARPL